jgi:hypothetical protein
MSSSNWIFEDIAKGREEAYFRQKEQELIAALRQKGQKQRERERLAEALGIHDEEILVKLEELGFSRDTVAILHLVPLVQIAWSDDGVSKDEREKIYQLAALRGVTPGTPGFAKLETLLNERPSERDFDFCWRIIRAILVTWPENQREMLEVTLPTYASEVARVSGGWLGFHSISKEESAALQRIGRELSEAHAEPD